MYYSVTSPLYTTEATSSTNYYTSSYSEPRSYAETHSTSHSYNEPLRQPSLTWESFVLINIELDRLSTKTGDLQSENEMLKVQANNAVKLSSENDQLRQKMTELENKVAELNVQVSDKSKENDAWKAKYNDMSLKAKEHLALNENMVKENKKYQGELVGAAQVSAEFANLKTKNAEQSQAWQSKIEEMNAEVKKIMNLHESTLKENEKFKEELAKEVEQAMNLKIQAQEFKNQLNALNLKNEKLNTILTERDQTVKKLKTETNELTTKLIQSEKERLDLKERSDIMRELMQVFGAQVATIQEILSEQKDPPISYIEKEREELDRFQDIIKKLEIVKEAISQLIMGKEGFERSIKAKETQIEKVKSEIKQLVKRNGEKQKEVDKAKSQLSKLSLDINTYKSERDQMERELCDVKVQKSIYETQVQDLIERNKSCHRNCRLEPIYEFKELKVKMARIESAEKRLKVLARENSRLNDANHKLTAGIMDKSSPSSSRSRFSKLHALVPNSTVHSRASLTPQSSKVGLDSSPKINFTDYYIEDGSEKSLRTIETDRNEEQRLLEDKVIYQLVLKKEKEIGELNMKLGKAEKENEDLRKDLKRLDGFEMRLKSIVEEKERLEALLKANSGKESFKDGRSFTFEQPEDQSVGNERILKEKMKKIEEVMLNVREFELEMSQIIIQAKKMIFLNENEEIEKMLGKIIYEIEEWKVKFMMLDRMFMGIKQQQPILEVQNEPKAKNPMKKSFYDLGNAFSPKSQGKVEAKISLVNVSGDSLSASTDSSPFLTQQQGSGKSLP